MGSLFLWLMAACHFFVESTTLVESLFLSVQNLFGQLILRLKQLLGQ